MMGIVPFEKLKVHERCSNFASGTLIGTMTDDFEKFTFKPVVSSKLLRIALMNKSCLCRSFQDQKVVISILH